MPRGHSSKNIDFKKVGIIFDFYLGLSQIYYTNSIFMKYSYILGSRLQKYYYKTHSIQTSLDVLLTIVRQKYGSTASIILYYTGPST